MALLSDLVRIVAAVEGLEEVSVGIFARQAREAGFISQGGRGRSAAKMTVRDAANLLIAVNGCSLAKEVPDTVKQIRSLKADQKNVSTALGIGRLSSTFGDDFERLIETFVDQGRDEPINKVPGVTYVRFLRPDLMVHISMSPDVGGKYKEEKITYGEDLFGYNPLSGDRSDETVISQATLIAVAQIL